MKVGRRNLLKTAGAITALSVPLSLVLDRSGRAASGAARRGQGIGKPALLADRLGICDLPPGFHYTLIEKTPGKMSDGHQLPASPDGMGCFAGSDDTFILLRNHELDRTLFGDPFSGVPPGQTYDPRAPGCVTRVVVHAKTLQRLSSNLVLAGTLRNCAGGVSPWGWLSCEESVAEGHGYVFLCATDATSLQPPRKIAGYGRFNHEAVCIDPRTHIAYLTEDRTDGCLYRFVPVSRDRPFEGHLEALAVVDEPRLDTGLRLPVRKSRAVRWVRLPTPDPSDDSLRFEAHDRGAALVRRGEGIWFHDGAVYFSATSGGARGLGQIFRLSIGKEPAPDRLEVLIESTDSASLDAPDNITVAPWGDVYIAEDGPGEQYIRGLTPSGRVFDFARNARDTGEFAGVCFSPDGSALFLNLQSQAITLAVRGPFQRLSV